MDITLADIIQLQQEAGLAENDQRLRAIVAERHAAELEAQLAAAANKAASQPLGHTPTP